VERVSADEVTVDYANDLDTAEYAAATPSRRAFASCRAAVTKDYLLMINAPTSAHRPNKFCRLVVGKAVSFTSR